MQDQKITVNFIERRDADTSSIEKVFRKIASQEVFESVNVIFEKLKYGNSFKGMLQNLLNFRPQSADIYHVTGHVNYYAMPLPKDRTVLTIHDLQILKVRRGIRRFIIKKFLFDMPVNRARYVTAISENTKRELIKETGCDPKKIKVIENPLTIVEAESHREFNFERPTILQVGTAPHKNLARTIEAVAGMQCKLVILGEVNEEITESLKQNNIDYENRKNLSDEEMSVEYQNADIVVFCSLAEGFGLPIVEAQAMKVPVITSDLSPMKEVAGGGALLVDPFNSDAIKNAVERITNDAALRKRLVEKGTVNIKRFDPAKIANDYLQLYQKMLSAK